MKTRATADNLAVAFDLWEFSRLWRDQGKHEAARDLLQPVHGWFTEGLDTPELREADALVDELD